jgi:hypothetical protein
MTQQGQVFKLKTSGADGKPMWAYRYRLDGRRSARPQVGGFVSQGEAMQALKDRARTASPLQRASWPDHVERAGRGVPGPA